MLKLSVEAPLVYHDNGTGYARYRIDFENINLLDKYVLGWISPRYSKLESFEYLDRMLDWDKGWVREIYQTNVSITLAFKVRLYRRGLKNDMELLEEQNYLGMA